MQLGIKNKKASELAEKNSIKVIMNRCIMAEHEKLF
jgi:predicted CoA-binding protein